MVACAASEPRGPGIDVDRAMATVNELATTIGPRVQSTPEAKRTAAWIEAQLTAAGIAVERMEVGTVELPAVTVMGAIYRQAHPIVVSDSNLITRFGTGSGKALLLMAHYDTVALSPGAVDNSASVAILLELARTLQAEPPPQPVIIAFTAAEEAGLVGAEALAAEIYDRVSMAIALDLVGGDGELVVNGASSLVGTAEMRWLASAAASVGATIDVPAAHRVVSRWWPLAERSDHGPFTRRGTRAIHFYNRGNDGEWIDLAYHSARDVPARVKREAVAEVGRLLRALVASPVPAHTSDGFWLPFVHGVVIPRAVLVAIETLLVLVVLAVLVFSRAGLLAWLARSRDDKRGPALLIGIACYGVAVASAIAVENFTDGDQLAPWLYAPGRALVAYACVIAGVFGLATRLVARFLPPWRGEARFSAVAMISLLAFGAFWLAVGAPEVAWVWLVPAAVIALAAMVPRTNVAPTLAAARGARVPIGGRLAAARGARVPIGGRPAVARRIAVGLPVLARRIAGGLPALARRIAVGMPALACGALVTIAVALTALPIVLALHPDRLREAVWNGFLPITIPVGALLAVLGIPVAASASWAVRRGGTYGPMGTLLLGVGCGVLVIVGVVLAVTAPVVCTPAEFVRFLLACERV